LRPATLEICNQRAIRGFVDHNFIDLTFEPLKITDMGFIHRRYFGLDVLVGWVEDSNRPMAETIATIRSSEFTSNSTSVDASNDTHFNGCLKTVSPSASTELRRKQRFRERI
jgi:hypothetical protein